MCALRIGIATFGYPIDVGGGGLYATILAQELAELGEEVHVFATSENDSKPEVEGLFFHHVPAISWPFASISYWISLQSKVRAVTRSIGVLDVIHCMGTSGFGLPKRGKSWRLGVCSIFHLAQATGEEIQPGFISRLKRLGGEIGLMPLLEKRCIDWADCIATLSEDTKREISRRYEKEPDCIDVIPPAIPPEMLRLSELPLGEFDRNIEMEDENNILFVGRVYYRKRIDFLLRAFKKVLKEEDARLWIVGPGNSDPYQKLARRLGIEGKVTFTGTIDRMALVRLYNLCDVFAFPSANEGFGFVFVEAMINRLPIVAIDRTSIPEVVKECGILVDPSDLRGFAHAILQLLKNEDLRLSLGEAGRAKVAREYSDWTHVSKRMRDFYLNQTRRMAE